MIFFSSFRYPLAGIVWQNKHFTIPNSVQFTLLAQDSNTFPPPSGYPCESLSPLGLKMYNLQGWYGQKKPEACSFSKRIFLPALAVAGRPGRSGFLLPGTAALKLGCGVSKKERG
jgi:hypothetical protein